MSCWRRDGSLHLWREEEEEGGGGGDWRMVAVWVEGSKEQSVTAGVVFCSLVSAAVCCWVAVVAASSFAFFMLLSTSHSLVLQSVLVRFALGFLG